jgi:large subunit ribosomal protein L30e
MADLDKAITKTVKTGKVEFGASEAVRSARLGKAKLVIVASTSPSAILEDLRYYGKASQVPIITYKGDRFDLGRVCGKRFTVATLTIKDAGDSEILELANEDSAGTAEQALEEF